MARRASPLTDTEIKKAKPKEKEYILCDGHGLSLRIKPNGSKLWLFNYIRPILGTRTNLGLGTYPIVSLAEARMLRDDCRKLLAQQIDPKKHREELERKQLMDTQSSFEKVAELWKEKKSSEVEEKTINKYWRNLELHLLPLIGKYSIKEIQPSLVVPMLKKVEENGSPDMVNRLCGHLNEILNFAVNSGLIESNTCLKISSTFKSVRQRNNPRVSSEEIPTLIKRIHSANIKKKTKLLILFQLLTMVRPSEASNAAWNEFDFDKKEWTIPAERMKARFPHTVPLSSQVMALIEQLRPMTGHTKYLFTHRSDLNKTMSSSTVNMALKKMGYEGQQTAHGFRGLARTFLAEQGVQHEHAEVCLAHKTGGQVSLAYNHANYLEQRRDIMQIWGDHIEKCSQY